MAEILTKYGLKNDIWPLFHATWSGFGQAVAAMDAQCRGRRLQMFDDRLDLYSPGAIPNTMTIESMPLRQYSRNELLTSLLARCTIPSEHLAYSGRATMMDKRGEGVPIILNESWKLSRKKPKYQHLEDELLLTIYPADQPVPYPG